MFRKTIEEGFVSVQNEEQAATVINGGNCYLYNVFHTDGTLRTQYIIAKTDAAKAVASTPPGFEGHIVDPHDMYILCSTTGFYLNRVNMEDEERFSFISEVQKYQEGDLGERILFVEQGGGFDNLKEILDAETAAEAEKERARATLSLYTPYGDYENCIGLRITQYAANNSLCVMLTIWEDDYPEDYGFATVCLPNESKPEAFFAYIDVNNNSGIEKFLVDNDIARPSLGNEIGRSGYVSYPLYRFNEARLKELCPDGFEAYANGCAIQVL